MDTRSVDVTNVDNDSDSEPAFQSDGPALTRAKNTKKKTDTTTKRKTTATQSKEKKQTKAKKTKKAKESTPQPLLFINHNPIHADKLLCNICNQPDGHFQMNMQICCECGVAVHEECYGLNNTDMGRKYPEWKCHACKGEYI